MRKTLTAFVATLVMLGLAGCDATESYNRAGMWQPTGSNSRNLAAMIVNPKDLIRGHGGSGAPGIEAAPPVGALWSGKANPLPAAVSQGSTITINNNTVSPQSSGQ